MITNGQDLATRFRSLGKGDGEPIALTIEEMVFSSEDGAVPRMWLPPIQRSLVWDNQRIIQFWDSLFRAYPIGTMLVHPPQPSEAMAVGSHMLQVPEEGDLALFDGQQRLHALRLGFGLLSNALRKIWIDLAYVKVQSDAAATDSGLCLPLRISGPGQPFGYDATKPNSKYGADKQREMLGRDRKEAWESDTLDKLIDAKSPVPLAWFFTKAGKVRLASPSYDGEVVATVRKMTEMLRNLRILLVPVPQKIVSHPQDYQRFFERIGRGGVSLSDKELAYSMIKQQLPHVRAQMEGIKGVGRIADEVDLVLGCFRIARTLENSNDRDHWQRTSYPRAENLKGFTPTAKQGPEPLFLSFLPQGTNAGLLKDLFEQLSSDLCDKQNNGLPRLLLPHISGELWHVLLLLRHLNCEGSSRTGHIPQKLTAFVLWWLLFVGNEQKAAQEVFEQARQKLPLNLPKLVRSITDNKQSARRVLLEPDQTVILNSISEAADLLDWDKRFGEYDHLRYWADNQRIRQRALIWLHRDELLSWNETKEFDPISDNEDDLPIEFDHLIPQSRWAFHWSDNKVIDKTLNGFRHGRWHCGNAIGNFRILTSSENASRGDARLTDADVETLKLAPNGETWIALSGRAKDGPWDMADIRSFQFVTHRRTMELYVRLVHDSGIADLVRTAAASPSVITADEQEL